MIGLDVMAMKKNAPYVGAGLGALVGLLLMAYTGKHTGSRWTGRALLPMDHRPVSATVKNGIGVAVGAAAFGSVGYYFKKKERW